MSCDDDPIVIRVEKLLDEGYAITSHTTDSGQFKVELYPPQGSASIGWGNCFADALKAADNLRIKAGG